MKYGLISGVKPCSYWVGWLRIRHPGPLKGRTWDWGPWKAIAFDVPRLIPLLVEHVFVHLDSCITAWSLFLRRLKTSSLVICAKTGCSMNRRCCRPVGCSLSKIATRCMLTAHWQDSGVFHQAAQPNCWDSPPTIANMGSWTWIDLEGAQQLWRVSLCFQRV